MSRKASNSVEFLRVIVVIAGLLSPACSGNASLPPTSPTVGATGAESGLGANGGPGLPFIAVAGTASGRFNLVHTESDRNGFTADSQLTISVEGASPNTVLYLRRAGDLGLGNQQADGLCQRAAAGLFSQVPLPQGGFITVETSPGGSGAANFHLFGTSEGNTIDVVFQLVDALPPSVPTVDLRTPCFTFTVK